MPSGRVFQFTYDSDGGLRHITLPSGTKHSFSCQPSLGFIRVTYTPPGSTRSYIQHYTNEGALLQTVHPGDGARVVYRYHHSGLLSEVRQIYSAQSSSSGFNNPLVRRSSTETGGARSVTPRPPRTSRTRSSTARRIWSTSGI